MRILSNIIHWYFSKKALPHWCIFIIDCLIVFLSAFVVFTIQNGLMYTAAHFTHLCGTLFFYMIFYVVGFRLFHTYSSIIRFSSFVDLQRVGYACGFGMILCILSRFISEQRGSDLLLFVRIRDIAVWTAIAVFLMWAVRVAVKYAYDTLYKQRSAKKAFIYGIMQGGVGLAKSMRNQDPAKYTLDGFISDQPESKGSMLMGVKVYYIEDNVVDLMVSRGVEALFVSPLRSEALRNNEEFVSRLIEAGIKIFMVPTEYEWDGKSDLNPLTLREVMIEDLLPREQIEVDMEQIGNLLHGKRILITGAAGSIGSEIARQVALFEPALMVLIDQAETPLHDLRLLMTHDFKDIDAPTIVSDIANSKRMEGIFQTYKPEYVFHAAAYKHVPMMEDNPAESIQNNVEGTRIVADLAVKYNSKKFVMISTDKAVNPTNVMGCSKRICEIYVQSLDAAIKKGQIKGCTQFVTTRFGNVLGSNGSVIPLFKEQIRKGGPITVTHPDIIRYFMLIPEACKLVLEAATMGHGGEIFVFDMGKPVKIVDLAKRMILLSGAHIEIKFTGLRDGEKLYEEVLNDKEVTLPTFHPKIKIAKVREYDYDEANRYIDRLFDESTHLDDMAIVALMKEMVPEFRSQHSKYESLDK